MRTCEYCGTVFEENRLVCPNCGKAMEEVAKNVAPEPAPPMAGPPQEAPCPAPEVAPEAPPQNQQPILGAENPVAPMQMPLPDTPPARPQEFTPPPAGYTPVPPPPAWGAGSPPPAAVSPQPIAGGAAGWYPPSSGTGMPPVSPVGAMPPPPPGSREYYGPQQWEDIQKNKNMAVLAYLGTLILVPAIAAQHSPYAKFHLNQALSLLIVRAIVSAGSGLIGAILGLVLGPLGWFAYYICAIVLMVFWIIGLVNAATGKFQPLPLIGKIQLVHY